MLVQEFGSETFYNETRRYCVQIAFPERYQIVVVVRETFFEHFFDSDAFPEKYFVAMNHFILSLNSSEQNISFRVYKHSADYINVRSIKDYYEMIR